MPNDNIQNFIYIIIVFIVIFSIVWVLLNYKEIIYKEQPEIFDNIVPKSSSLPESLPKYHTYILTDNDMIKYELFTFSQLNFNLQKQILNKIIDSSYSNIYKNLLDIDNIIALINTKSKYNPINDIVFAVRLNRITDPKIISYGQELLFNEHNAVNYSLMNGQQINLSESLLLIYENILTVSLPNNEFNITNNNKFINANINNNQINSKYIKLLQIDDLPIYLINLTDDQYNIKINEQILP